MSILLLGIDPGVNGALALLWPKESNAEVYDLPTVVVQRGGKNRTEYNEGAVVELLAEHASAAHCYMEYVQPGSFGGNGRKAGSVSMFNFGDKFGFLRGVLHTLQIPFTLVRPVDWKRAVGLRSGATKGDSINLASQLYPCVRSSLTRKKDEHRAEALLLAHLGSLTYGNGIGAYRQAVNSSV